MTSCYCQAGGRIYSTRRLNISLLKLVLRVILSDTVIRFELNISVLNSYGSVTEALTGRPLITSLQSLKHDWERRLGSCYTHFQD